ncbi:MAG: S41 family peptidase [Planctomycetota bacterium]|nr:S41 family peptidase [Planctomycetota bacterium]
MHEDRSLPTFRSALTTGFLALGLTTGPVVAGSEERAATDGSGTSMHRYPDISNDEIVFVYANDLWRVPIEGGVALPLASPPGLETMPRFSPDGTEVAFLGNYEGGRDIYVVPVDGGLPRRVTHHPTGERLSDWTPDGDLLFSARGMGGVPRAERIHRVGREGGLPEALPLPYGANAALHRGGEWVAYTPNQRDGRTWKRYVGGMASDIWLVNLETGESRRATDWEGTDSFPMWHGDTMYYLSDQGPEHRLNLWRYDLDSGERDQVTRFADYDVKWPSIGPDDGGPARIVFQNGPSLYVHDARAGETVPVPIEVPGATATLRPALIDASDFISDWTVSPSGKRAAVSARGDIWTLPAKNGSPRNLTRSAGTAERTPSWSPDGRWIAYFSDEPGEYELFVRSSDGRGEARRLTDDLGPFKNAIWWSPDSNAIVYADKTGEAFHVDVESGDRKSIGRNPWGAFPKPSFSHDGRWIAWGAADENAPVGRIRLHDTTTGETHVVTSGMFSDDSPAFDRKGDWLYFTSDRNFQPNYSSLDNTWIYDDSGVLVAVPLRADVESPWLVESDEESWEEDEEESEDSEPSEESDRSEGDEDAELETANDPVTGTWECVAEIANMGEVPMTISLILNEDDLVTGTVSTPMFGGSITGAFDPESMRLELTLVIEGGPTAQIELVIEDDRVSGTASSDEGGATITGNRIGEAGDDDDEAEGDEGGEDAVEIDLEGFEGRAMRIPVAPGSFRNLVVNDKNQLMYSRDGGIKVVDITDNPPVETSAGSGGRFMLTADGKKMLVPRGAGASIRKAGPGDGGDRVVTDPMLVTIDPREEWRQLLTDAWRIQRDWFYDPGLHGVDWDAVLEAYLPLVDHATTREDVSYLIGEMISELNVGHAYYWGGDGESQPSMNVGMLAVDWAAAPGEGDTPDGWRIEKVLGGGPWDLDARSPLDQPGLDLDEDDIVVAVNGVPTDLAKDPWKPFVGLANRTVVLDVLDDQSETGRRTVAVKTISGEDQHRYRDWIEGRRRLVEEMSDGRVGYIYVPNTGRDGQSDLVRQFQGQAMRPALIVDERWNGGGQIPDRFIAMLDRPVTNHWARRDAVDWKWPPSGHNGPKAMLINGLAGSGGDMFPWLFRHHGLGPLIGTRTWGGLVGISGNPTLIDGGYTAVPTFGFYETDGTWGIEGHGVDPDIEVVDDPGLMLEGGDPQLERAIEVMLEALENEGEWSPAPRPASPDRSGMGIAEEDK